jgi:hypothetical protein
LVPGQPDRIAFSDVPVFKLRSFDVVPRSYDGEFRAIAQLSFDAIFWTIGKLRDDSRFAKVPMFLLWRLAANLLAMKGIAHGDNGPCSAAGWQLQALPSVGSGSQLQSSLRRPRPQGATRPENASLA